VLALTEARVLKQQTKAKMDERRAEIRAERERLEREREESTDPESLPPLPSEEDVDENEIDVPGWEEKRRWLFGLELATGPSPVFPNCFVKANVPQISSSLLSIPSSLASL
jgi:E3 ubiquitin-protein ligase synoviolin